MAFLFLDKRNIIIGAIILSIVFALGVIIGYYGNDSSAQPQETSSLVEHLMADQFLSEQKLIEDTLEAVDSISLRNYLKELTKEPHIAGHRRDNELIDYIYRAWTDMGLDNVELAEYDFYLSWPNASNPNKIHLLEEDGSILFTSHHQEKELRPGDGHEEFIPAFNAYTPPGTVEGDLIYVHYARVEDLRQLKEMGMNVTGKICMARYGKIFRGNKVKNCEDAGAIGVILFSDPGDVAVQGTEPENVYPNTIFLPGTGVQRGSTFIGDGDPLSPEWPSVPNAYRLSPEEAPGLPKIPTQPIGYDDAKILLESMAGDPVPEDWKGQINNITYRLGGEMTSGRKVKLSTHNYFGTVKSSNVLGYIRGSVEPDRYVFLSNHRDAWGYGSVDPSSGTAQLMEVARTFGNLLSKNWRPRRTIVLASWAAEEYGLEGSYEWVSQKISKLMQRSVGLVNTDICVSGPIVKPQASPVLKDIVINALKQADDPTTEGNRKYFEFWHEWTNQDEDTKNKEPEMSLLGSGTDHAPFAFMATIPAINLRFKDDTKKYKGVGQYPMYHTGYETFYLMDKLIDPGFKIHRTCAQTSLHLLMELADSALLPYNLERFPASMKTALEGLDKASNVTLTLEANGATLKFVKQAIDEFEKATQKFMSHIEDVKSSGNPMQLRMVNDQMMQLERVFNTPTGLPGRPDIRNAIFAPGKFNAYAGGAFPGISDLLHEIDDLSPPEKSQRVSEIKRHLSDLMIMIQEAASFLKPLDMI